jgi:KUP system potassium uptake protein
MPHGAISPPEAQHPSPRTKHHLGRGPLGPLALAALGVVFGDIGTSPLYAIKECVHGEHGVAATRENVLGVLSLIVWSLVCVVTIKYLTFILRADNEGEGGIFALYALTPDARARRWSPRAGWVLALAVLGSALLYGDGVITPAISVLSAVEGLEVATSALEPAIVPVTCAILAALFLVQRFGSGGLGKVFGAIMLLWFVVLAALGLLHIKDAPSILGALDPRHAIAHFTTHRLRGFAVLGSVVLVLTGSEALYADIGHFGRGPIKLTWYALVLPALLLNYFGQGALLLAHPEAASNPFYAMVPRGLYTYALVGLATVATVIASQALISGAFSLTHQAMRLDFLPHMPVMHTSHEMEGQIYIPRVNWLLGAGCVALVLLFRSSSRLASAYGLAVTGTMVFTSILYFEVTHRTFGWSLLKAAPLCALFLLWDLSFLGANLLKFKDGGYVPVLIAVALSYTMLLWRRGRALLVAHLRKESAGARRVLHEFLANNPYRPPGTAVFLTSGAYELPPAMMHQIRFNRVLHERVVILTVVTEHVPRVRGEGVLEWAPEDAPGIHRLVIRTGYMQSPDVPRCLEKAAAQFVGLSLDPAEVTYYVGRETILATKSGEMGAFTEGLFAYLSRNQASAQANLKLPPHQVVELGVEVDL